MGRFGSLVKVARSCGLCVIDCLSELSKISSEGMLASVSWVEDVHPSMLNGSMEPFESKKTAQPKYRLAIWEEMMVLIDCCSKDPSRLSSPSSRSNASRKPRVSNIANDFADIEEQLLLSMIVL